MNITSPILSGAWRAAELPADSAGPLLRAVGAGTGLFDDGADAGLGTIMSALSGVAAALAIAILLTIYFRSGYRSRRDLVRHGLAATAVLALLAFVISDMRNAALAYLGINPERPSAGFDIRLPKAAIGGTAAGRPANDIVATSTPEGGYDPAERTPACASFVSPRFPIPTSPAACKS